MDFELFDLYLDLLPNSFAEPIASVVPALMDEAGRCDESEHRSIPSLEVKLYPLCQRLDQSPLLEFYVTGIYLELMPVPSDLLLQNCANVNDLTAVRILESSDSTQTVVGTPAKGSINTRRRLWGSGGVLPLANAKSIAGHFADRQTNCFLSTIWALGRLELSSLRTKNRRQVLRILLCFNALKEAFNSLRQIEQKRLSGHAV